MILALLRDFALSSTAAGRETVVLGLPRPLNAYDLRTARSLGSADRLTIEPGPVEPTLLALSEEPFAPPSVSGPPRARLGANAEFSIRPGAPAALDVLRVDVIDPEGATVGHYSGNMIVAGAGVKLLPIAFNDKTGIWKIRVKDLLSGETATASLNVEP